MRRILIVDTSSLLHAVKFSLAKHKLTHEQQPTFVIFGWLDSMLALNREICPMVTVFAIDSKTSIRKDMYPNYKSKRQEKTEELKALDDLAFPQFDLIQDRLIGELGYRNVFGAEGFEADDVIARVTKKYKDSEIVFASSDKDLYQLLTDNVVMFKYNTKAFYTIEDFRDEYDIEPKMWKRVKTYGGCTSDNVEGIPIPEGKKNIGEGYALKYIKGNLPEHYKAYKAFVVPENKSIIKRNKQLVILPHRKTPDFNIRPDHLSKKALMRICKEFGFKSIYKDIHKWSKIMRLK
jgi:DNA polymerase I